MANSQFRYFEWSPSVPLKNDARATPAGNSSVKDGTQFLTYFKIRISKLSRILQ